MKFVKLVSPKGVVVEIPEANKAAMIGRGFKEPKQEEKKPERKAKK